jgi:uncharacterized protein (DUF1697 family)
MDELRRLFEELGFSQVETFIASGNVIFTAAEADAKTLETQIAAHLRESLGYEVVTFLRTDAETVAVASYKPFSDEQLAVAAVLNIAFLAEPLNEEGKQTLKTFRTEISEFHTHGREVYWLCRVTQSESKFSTNLFERLLKVKATFRNANTVRRLAAKYG